MLSVELIKLLFADLLVVIRVNKCEDGLHLSFGVLPALEMFLSDETQQGVKFLFGNEAIFVGVIAIE